jgi:uncharacterized protein (TIGR03435 family)
MESRKVMKNYALIASTMLVPALSASVLAQIPAAATPAFEVASVKPNPAGGNRIDVAPGRITITSATLATCIKWAWNVRDSQISGANSAVSDLLNSERYDIVAKSAELVPNDQLKLMLQSLLADRFRLTFHRQPREMQAYALLVEKNGPKFHESQGDGESKQQAKSKLTRQWTLTGMAQFADVLSEAMEAPVLDRTGLSARYDFNLDLTPYMPPAGERPDIAAMMVTAIREQLGLKLESRREAIDVMVIDRLEKPSAN